MYGEVDCLPLRNCSCPPSYLWVTFHDENLVLVYSGLAQHKMLLYHKIYSCMTLDILAIDMRIYWDFNISSSHLSGMVLSPPLLSTSRWGTGYQRNCSFQLKPPYVMSDPVWKAKLSSLITSMMGHTTFFLLFLKQKWFPKWRENRWSALTFCKCYCI